MPPRLPAVSGVYVIAVPDGSLNPNTTSTDVLGASDDPTGSGSTYRLPSGAKQPVAPDLLTRLTPAGRSSKIKNSGPETAVEPVFFREIFCKYNFKFG